MVAVRQPENDARPGSPCRERIQHMDLMDIVRLNVERLLKRRGMTQKHLAQAAGLSPSAISRFLSSGRDSMTLETLEKLGTGLGVRPGRLLIPPDTGPHHPATGLVIDALGLDEQLELLVLEIRGMQGVLMQVSAMLDEPGDAVSAIRKAIIKKREEFVSAATSAAAGGLEEAFAGLGIVVLRDPILNDPLNRAALLINREKVEEHLADFTDADWSSLTDKPKPE